LVEDIMVRQNKKIEEAIMDDVYDSDSVFNSHHLME